MSAAAEAAAKIIRVLASLTADERSHAMDVAALAFEAPVAASDPKREQAANRMRTLRERRREQGANTTPNMPRTASEQTANKWRTGGEQPPEQPANIPRTGGEHAANASRASESGLSDSDLSLSQQSQSLDLKVSTAREPAASRASVAGTALDYALSRMLDAYAVTVRDAAKRTWAFPSKLEQRSALLEALDGHALNGGKPCEGTEEREAWLRFTLPHYVAHVLAEERRGGDARKFATLAPTGFLAWLNRNPERLPEPERESGVMQVAPAALRGLAAGIGGGR
jgi:hypothetical protein